MPAHESAEAQSNSFRVDPGAAKATHQNGSSCKRRCCAGSVYRVTVIGDQRTGKTEFLKWFLKVWKTKEKWSRSILVGEFIRESDYVRVEGSLHRFQSFHTDQLREDWKARYSSKYERKAILQRKNFNKRYRATVSPLFYDLPFRGIIDGSNESGGDTSLEPGTDAGGPKLQVWDTSEVSFSPGSYFRGV